MTVCIAAIYNGNSIFAASDRMVTGGYGDTTFEPPMPKIFAITSSIAVLTAGDQSIQSQTLIKVRELIKKKIDANPTKWVDVSDAAKIYADSFTEIRSEALERFVLSKYGLTFKSFAGSQSGMKDLFIEMINDELRSASRNFGGVETLVVGIDDSGPHIYIVNGEIITCNDMAGFAAVGIGQSHASSHFMLSSYSKFANESNALLTIHQAKKKSEVSPGVGKATDMCVIGPDKGSFTFIKSPPMKRDVIKDLDNFYAKYVKSIERVDKTTKKAIEGYLRDLLAEPAKQQNVSPVEKPEPIK